MLVPISQIGEGNTYIMPWRPPGIRAGKVERIGNGSVVVHQPKNDGTGWEDRGYAIARNTMVEPCDPEEYLIQGFGKGGRRTRNRSTVRKPVDVVWELCDEMIGRGNKPTVEDRDKMVAAAVEQGVNVSTAKTQYYAWRKKHGAR